MQSLIAHIHDVKLSSTLRLNVLFVNLLRLAVLILTLNFAIKKQAKYEK